MQEEQQLTRKQVNSRAKTGLIIMLSRAVVLNIIKTFSIYLLAIWLTPKDYGIYGVLNSWIGFSYFFLDIGTFMALLIQDEAPTKKQLQTSSACHLLLSSILGTIFFIFAPTIVQYSNMDQEAILMLRVMAVSLPIYALRTNPRLILERQVKFNATASAEIAETLGMYICQFLLAYLGYGAWSFIMAAFTRAVVGSSTLLLIVRQFYIPRIYWKELKGMLNFGFSFQLNNIINASSSLILPIIVSPILAVNKIGLITWSLGIANIAFYLTSNFNTVFLPALSRLQNDVESSKKTITRSLNVMILILGYFYAGMAVCSSSGVDLFFEPKWSPAKPLLVLAIVAQFFFNTFYLIGTIILSKKMAKFKLATDTSIFLLLIAFIFLGVKKFGAEGYFYANILCSFLTLLIYTGSVFSLINIRVIWRFFSIALAGFFSYYIFSKYWPLNFWPLFFIFHIVFFPLLIIADYTVLKDMKWIIEQILQKLKGRKKQNV